MATMAFGKEADNSSFNGGKHADPEKTVMKDLMKITDSQQVTGHKQVWR